MLFRYLLIGLLLYWGYKIIVRLIAPFFAGYYGANDSSSKSQANTTETRKGNITIRQKKSNEPTTLNIDKADIEDADFEEIK